MALHGAAATQSLRSRNTNAPPEQPPFSYTVAGVFSAPEGGDSAARGSPQAVHSSQSKRLASTTEPWANKDNPVCENF